MPRNDCVAETPVRACLGMGLVSLDIVTTGDEHDVPRFWAGGTCGNVLTILAFLGWHSLPIARLGKDEAARIVLKDMRQHNVDLCFISRDEQVKTPIIIERIRSSFDKNMDVKPTHRFYWVCPNCGAWLPRYRPVLLKEVQALDEGLPKIKCFFFDRVSPASLYMAEKARAQGAFIIFEPPNIKDDQQFKKAISLCDVIKYSNDRIKYSTKSIYDSSAYIVVETLGADGLRFRLRKNGKNSKWKLLSAFHVKDVKDTAGAGDWCTAGMIDALLNEQFSSFRNINEQAVVDALRYGQALSALNCTFEGARGAMYSFDRNKIMKQVRAILNRKEAVSPSSNGVSFNARRTIKCICPTCQSAAKEK